MFPLRQSTGTQTVMLGPFIDNAGGTSVLTGLTIGNTDIRVSKNGANIIAKNSGGATHDEIGMYTATLDASDTDTVGRLQVMINATGSLFVYHEFEVLEEAAYDAIYAAAAAPATAAGVSAVETDTQDIQSRLPAALVSGRIDASVGAMATDVLTSAALNANAVTEIQSGLATAASITTVITTLGTPVASIAGDIAGVASDIAALNDLSATDVESAVWDASRTSHTTNGTFGQQLQAIRSATLQAGSSSTVTLDASASAVDDFYNNALLYIVSGTGAGQARFISDYVGSSKIATVNGNWVTNPDNTSVFIIEPFGAIPGASAPSAAEVADAVWDEDATAHQNAGSFGAAIGDPGANTDTIYNAVVTAAAGIDIAADIIAIKSVVDSILTDTAEIGAAGAGLTELASAANLAVAQADLDTITGADGVIIASGTQTFDLVGTQTGTIIGNLSGSVIGNLSGSVSGNVVGSVGVVAGNVNGSVLGTIGSLATQAKADVNAEVDTALADYDAPTHAELTSELAGADDATLAAIAALNDLSAAEVNAEVVDVLFTDTYAEPTGVPPATTTLANRVAFLYEALRNRVDVDGTNKTFYDNSNTPQWVKVLSDDGTTFSESKATTP